MIQKAAVTGEIVDVLYKNTARLTVNPATKITNIIALLLLAALTRLC